jgi:hypothetical protein
MALFFDAEWFDSRLRMVGLSHADVATALGLLPEQINEVWKDQRELKVNDVRVLAALLGSEPADVAARAGISTPVPRNEPPELAAFAERIARIERTLVEIRDLLLALNKSAR